MHNNTMLKLPALLQRTRFYRSSLAKISA